MREEIEKILSEFFTFAHYQGNGEGTKEEAQEKLQQATDAILGLKIDEVERLKDIIILILPMAKGYAYGNKISSNLEYIRVAESAIAV